MRMYFEMDPQETKDLIQGLLQAAALEKARDEVRVEQEYRQKEQEKMNKETHLILDELKTIKQNLKHQENELEELVSEVARMKQYSSTDRKQRPNNKEF